MLTEGFKRFHQTDDWCLLSYLPLSLFQNVDEYIGQTKDKLCDTLVHFGRKGLNVAATAAVMAATKVMQSLDILVFGGSGP